MRTKIHMRRGQFKKLIKYIALMTLIIMVIIGALVGTSFSLFSYNAPGRKENTIVTGSSEVKLKCDPISADTSGANNPKDSLPRNMIPVCYNSENDVWLKADSTNSDDDYRWYSYNDKAWANAVTTTEEGYTAGTTEKDKEVNIENKINKILSYTSSNKGVDYSTSSSVFTFTAGSDGTYSFDWSVSGGYSDRLTITVNGTALSDVNGVSGVKSGTYTGDAISGTTYTIIASYEKGFWGSTNDNIATISNFVLPSGSTEITHTVDSNNPDYQWNDNSYPVNSIPLSSSYKIENGKFVLGELSTQGSLVNKYMCSDGTSTTCDTLYLVKEATDNIISKVNSYSNIKKILARNYYLNAPVGTIIEMEHINTMFVWIPRFKATGDYTTYNGTNDINNPGAFDITFVDGKTIAHDAFTFETKEIYGFWIGKFEISHTILATINSLSYNYLQCKTYDCSNANGLLIKPNVKALRYNDVSNFFHGISSMNQSGNSFGFEFEPYHGIHMIKNNEWGAVAYLTQSIYGRCSSSTDCKEVYINNSNSLYTGRSGGNVSGSTPINATYPDQTSTDTENDTGYYTYDGYLLEYNTNNKTTTKDINKVASTTGNIYGVYDISGGAWEYVMGVSNTSIGNSGFSMLPDIDYCNIYTTEVDYTNSGLQHALIETKGWYGDIGTFVDNDTPWFYRGGIFTESGGGTFGFQGDNGKGNDTHVGSRAVIFGIY